MFDSCLFSYPNGWVLLIWKNVKNKKYFSITQILLQCWLWVITSLDKCLSFKPLMKLSSTIRLSLQSRQPSCQTLTYLLPYTVNKRWGCSSQVEASKDSCWTMRWYKQICYAIHMKQCTLFINKSEARLVRETAYQTSQKSI